MNQLRVAAALVAALGLACGDSTSGGGLPGAGDASGGGASGDTASPAPDAAPDAALADSGPGVGGDDAADAICTPFTLECAGPFARRQCNGSGTAWVESACPSQQGCVGGQCLAQVCTPSASTAVCLSEDSYEACNASGTAYELITCGPGTYCQTGSCIPRLCTPGATICKSFTQLKVCNEPGTAWEDGALCPQGGACFDGQCLSPCEVNIKDGSYLGCDYWAMDLDNIEESEFQVVGLVVSVPAGTSPTGVKVTNASTGQVLAPSEMGVDNTWVEAGSTKVFQLPLGYDIDGTMLTRRTFRIQTDAPVIVHQFNPLNGEGVFTNDASLLLPSNVTGQTYFVMSWPHRADAFNTLRGYATIIATQEGTTQVVVQPTAPVVASKPGAGITPVAALQPGKKQFFVLQQGQALNLETDGAEGADLTGTFIQADRKISVFAGHECANVPLGVNACDHLEQQLFPVETWSLDYVADAFKPRSASQVDVWRVMAGENDVVVETVPPVPGYGKFLLQRGQWIQFSTGASFAIKANGPVMVGHYLTGSTYPGAEIVCVDTGIGKDTAIGDPAFTLAAPTKRYLKEYAVLTPTGYAENYLNVIVPEGGEVSLDGVPLQAPVTPIPGSGYGLARQAVSPGVHTVTGTKPFGLTAYGYDCDVSYAYPGGLRLQAVTGN